MGSGHESRGHAGVPGTGAYRAPFPAGAPGPPRTAPLPPPPAAPGRLRWGPPCRWHRSPVCICVSSPASPLPAAPGPSTTLPSGHLALMSMRTSNFAKQKTKVGSFLPHLLPYLCFLSPWRAAPNPQLNKQANKQQTPPPAMHAHTNALSSPCYVVSPQAPWVLCLNLFRKSLFLSIFNCPGLSL